MENFASTLNDSSLEVSKETSEIQDVDQEIELCEQQISDIENLLSSIKSHSQERVVRYEKSINKLQTEIDRAKQSYEKEYQDQITRQEQEIQQLIDSQNQELKTISNAAKLLTNDFSNWTEISQSLLQLTNSNNLLEMDKQLESINSEENSFNITQSMEREMKRGIDEATNILNQNAIEKLQNDINQYKTFQHQEDQRFSQILQDFNIAQQNCEKCHALTVAKLNREIENRDKIFEKYLKIISQNLDNEKSKSEIDLSGNEKELEKFKQALISKSKMELDVVMQDINHIKELIENGANNEEDSVMNTNLFVSKVQSIERQNEILKMQIKQIQSEIATIQKNLQRGTIELKNAKQSIDEQDRNSSHFDQFSFV